MTSNRTIHLIAGARPNFMKIAPLYHALSGRGWCRPFLVHTGQHYDFGMSDVFFAELGLPVPDVALGIGGGSHGEQLGKVVMAYEKLLQETSPAMVIVVGDVNATAACTLAAKKLNLPVAHVEAGLRSRDRTMPEEINRIVTDSICDMHLAPSQDAVDNLLAENVPESCIHLVGNIMIDSFVSLEAVIRARPNPFPRLAEGGYAVATFHRPANVDEPGALRRLAQTLAALSRRLPVLFPVHPRTRQRLQAEGLMEILTCEPAVVISEPLGYVDFMRCVLGSALVVTDSGGVQEETTYLGIPCFTVRSSTERPITVTHGTNRLIGLDDVATLSVTQRPAPERPPLWDGKTAGRIAVLLERYLAAGAPLRGG